jgi:hypothetical protein
MTRSMRLEWLGLPSWRCSEGPTCTAVPPSQHSVGLTVEADVFAVPSDLWDDEDRAAARSVGEAVLIRELGDRGPSLELRQTV